MTKTLYFARHTVTYVPVGKTADKDSKTVNPGDLFDDIKASDAAWALAENGIREATSDEAVRHGAPEIDDEAARLLAEKEAAEQAAADEAARLFAEKEAADKLEADRLAAEKAAKSANKGGRR